MVAIRIFDRKHVTLLSTVYNTNMVDTGRKHWQTKEITLKHSIIHYNNKYMGAVDSNDQLLKHSAFCRRTIKWWKKVFFRLLNLCIVNAFILHREWLRSNSTVNKDSQTDFRTKLVKLMISACSDYLTPPTQWRL